MLSCPLDRIVTRTILVLVLAALLAAGCGSASPNEEATPTPILQAATSSKPHYTVERGTVAADISFSGRIGPVLDEQLFFRSDGRVSRVNVKSGDKVKKGDILAELEIGDLLNQLAQAEISVQTAQLRLTSSQQTLADQRSQAESALRVAQLRLAQARVKDPAPSVVIAAANREKASVAVQTAQAAYDVKAGRPDIAMSREAADLQKATIDFEIAKAQYDLAVQSQKSWEYDIQLLEESASVAEANLQKLSTTVDPTLAQDVTKQQLVYERLTAQVENGRLISPMDGQVTLVLATAGKLATAFNAVVTVADVSALEIRADLSSSTTQDLSVGQSCVVEITNYPSKTFTGTIRRVPVAVASATAVEEDRSTRITITDKSAPLELDALVRVTVVAMQKDNVLWIPPDALRSFQGREFVMVQDGDAQRRVPVKSGLRTTDRVEIVTGLTAGQVVVGQ